MIMSQHLINTTLGILSGPGALYRLRVDLADSQSREEADSL